ncbi:uncharacterized protein EDB91DRAFT_1254103 [Suillus paluster]|uniref:uncharacterized protein n=1 Tax=Suillus paluster TaxID=48578 RepID=UPI001B85B4E4|nr:uncharacterized protein EDB91DRAFT_1254103 [Suillus paluster]KAG1726989.1 hypothetical protein EDB91DRAFT_1254103 [Suillus paluster]
MSSKNMFELRDESVTSAPVLITNFKLIIAPRKKPTPSAASGSDSSAHWTIKDTSCLIEYVILHRAEGGDGVNFKQATLTVSVLLQIDNMQCGYNPSLQAPCEKHILQWKKYKFIVEWR